MFFDEVIPQPEPPPLPPPKDPSPPTPNQPWSGTPSPVTPSQLNVFTPLHIGLINSIIHSFIHSFIYLFLHPHTSFIHHPTIETRTVTLCVGRQLSRTPILINAHPPCIPL